MNKKLIFSLSGLLVVISFYSSAKDMFVSPSLNYNVNSNINNDNIDIGASIKLGYKFTDSIGFQFGVGSYGRDINKNIYLSTFDVNYNFLISERYGLYLGLGSYQYRSNINFLFSSGIKRRLNESLSLKVGYEFFNKAYIDDDIYSFGLAFEYIY